MFGYRKKNKMPAAEAPPSQILERLQGVHISSRAEETASVIERILGPNADFSVRRFHVFGRYPAILFYFTNMTDPVTVNGNVMKPLMQAQPSFSARETSARRLTDFILNDCLYAIDGTTEKQISIIIESLLAGRIVAVVDGLQEAFIAGSRSVDKRSIDNPATEQVIRGPREGFVEPIGTNLALLRYRLQTPDFRMDKTIIGRKTKSEVVICYLVDVANPELVEEAKRRLSLIVIDGVLDSGYLEQFIEDNHLSPFPQVQYTERPDKVVANLLEGRVAILVDGSPLALIVPSVFSQFYQTVEDYTERFLLMSAIRLARLIALVFSLVFPSLYVAIISFNPELIPTEFAVAVAGGRAGVPFPAVVEVLIIEISMEVLREATIRLPQQVGGALSIVGVLVIGQAAVSAGFASPITVVIIALTTIGSFATPAYNAALALRLLRFPLILLAGVFGLYGIMIGLILIANHLLSLKSFGVPYMGPLVPLNLNGLKDLLIRAPLWSMTKRPFQLHPGNSSRLGSDAESKLQQPMENTLDPGKFPQK